MMHHTILSPFELKELPNIRKFGTHVSDEKIQAYIAEVEMLYIKPVIGDDLYLKLADGQCDTCEECIATLLKGGIYTDSCGNRKHISGLCVAIAYFAFAQYIMSGDAESTRYGFVMKDGEYSSKISAKERSDNYNNVLQIAHGYLSECQQYIRDVMGDYCAGTPKITGSITIKKIG